MVSLLKSNYVKFVLVVYFRANNGFTYFLAVAKLSLTNGERCLSVCNTIACEHNNSKTSAWI